LDFWGHRHDLHLQCVGCDKKITWPFVGLLLGLIGTCWYSLVSLDLVGTWWLLAETAIKPIIMG
jgi:hypothetical protein